MINHFERTNRRAFSEIHVRDRVSIPRKRIVIYSLLWHFGATCIAASAKFPYAKRETNSLPIVHSANASGVVTWKCSFTRTCPGNTFLRRGRRLNFQLCEPSWYNGGAKIYTYIHAHTYTYTYKTGTHANYCHVAWQREETTKKKKGKGKRKRERKTCTMCRWSAPSIRAHR